MSLSIPATGPKVSDPTETMPHKKTKTRQLILLEHDHTDRKAAEDFVRQQFQFSYQADLKYFYPFLLVVKNTDNLITAVAGIRPAEHRSLFCEHYLEQTADNLLELPRNTIVEVGNLASSDTGQARLLVATCTAFLQGAGFSQVIFTLTPILANSFQRMGLTLRALADASIDKIPDVTDHDWGNYYEQNPKVYTGQIGYGYQQLLAKQTYSFRKSWALAYKTGIDSRLYLHKPNYQ